ARRRAAVADLHLDRLVELPRPKVRQLVGDVEHLGTVSVPGVELDVGRVRVRGWMEDGVDVSGRVEKHRDLHLNVASSEAIAWMLATTGAPRSPSPRMVTASAVTAGLLALQPEPSETMVTLWRVASSAAPRTAGKMRLQRKGLMFLPQVTVKEIG